jgi:hypothetical protein
MIKLITNHSMAHYIFHNHSKLELLKSAKTRFSNYYLTFRHLLKVRETLASMVSSDSRQDLKDRDQEVEDTMFDGQDLVLATCYVCFVVQ